MHKDMKLIMENWRSFVCESQVDDLTKQPEKVDSLITKIKNKDIDEEQLKQILILLAKDPKIQASAEFFKDSLENEGVKTEGLLDRLGTEAYLKIDSLKDAMNSSPLGKKILNNPATTLALGFLVYSAASEGFDVSALTDPETIQSTMDILKKGKSAKLDDVLETGMDAILELFNAKEEMKQ
jgi:hypothetical protein